MKTALVLGRFHAVTAAQVAWLESLPSAGVTRLVCVITSADHAGTRRNPFSASERTNLLRPVFERLGLPYSIVSIDDVTESDAWVQHVVSAVQTQAGLPLSATETTVFSSNHEVQALFTQRGFAVVGSDTTGPTPAELIDLVVGDKPWAAFASSETRAFFSLPGTQTTLKRIFGQSVLTADGELGHHRDFDSYGAQMDASLRQKLDDLLPWVKPGTIVDQGCGTGQLMVALAREYPTSRLVGVDLSREFLRRCDQLTYAAQDVSFVFGNVIDLNVPANSVTTVIYSSVMHEVHSYTGYQRDSIRRALRNALTSLVPSGRVLIRDGISPPPGTRRLTFHDAQTRETFEKFAAEFRHGAGARFIQLPGGRVELSAHDANEFLCKKDYLKNWHIEVHEEFGPFTLGEWGAVLRECGFAPLHLHEYCNGWIVENRYQGHVTITDTDDRPVPWPATNAVIVAEKPA